MYKKTQIIVKLIHSSLHSESKIEKLQILYNIFVRILVPYSACHVQ